MHSSSGASNSKPLRLSSSVKVIFRGPIKYTQNKSVQLHNSSFILNYSLLLTFLYLILFVGNTFTTSVTCYWGFVVLTSIKLNQIFSLKRLSKYMKVTSACTPLKSRRHSYLNRKDCQKSLLVFPQNLQCSDIVSEAYCNKLLKYGISLTHVEEDFILKSIQKHCIRLFAFLTLLHYRSYSTHFEKNIMSNLRAHRIQNYFLYSWYIYFSKYFAVWTQTLLK